MKKLTFQVQTLWTVKRKHNGVTEYTVQYNSISHSTYDEAITLALELAEGKLYTEKRIFQIIARYEIEL